jgi:flagellar assembly factor FliW
MFIDTSRFGKIDYKKTEVINMTRGLLGFDDYRRFIIVSINGQEPFKWFQSLDDPTLAFLIIDPLLFKPDYVVDVNPKDIALLDGRSVKDFVVFVIVTIPKGAAERMSANLQGPLLINTHKMCAAQLVLGESAYETQFPLYREIENHLAQLSA